MLNTDYLDDRETGPLPDDEDTYNDRDFLMAIEMSAAEATTKSQEVVVDVDNVRCYPAMLTARILYLKRIVLYTIYFLIFHIGYTVSFADISQK